MKHQLSSLVKFKEEHCFKLRLEKTNKKPPPNPNQTTINQTTHTQIIKTKQAVGFLPSPNLQDFIEIHTE